MTDPEEEGATTSVMPAVGDSRAKVQPVRGTRRGRALPRTFAALTHRNYRLFFIGQLISLVGTWMQAIAQAWLVYALTNSPLYLGIVGFASSVPTLVLSLGAGVVIDRAPKRTILLVTQTAEMLLAFVLAADYIVGWVQPWHIVILSFLLGVVDSLDAPTRQAFVVEMVGERQDLMNAIALNSAIYNAARVLGPTLAGIALALVGAGWCFVLNGLSFIAVIVGLRMMEVEPIIAAERRESLSAQLRQGVGYIWRNQTVLTLMGVVAVSNLFAFGYSTLLPAFAENVLNSGPIGLGFLSAAVGIGALAGALLVASLGEFRHKGVLLTIGNLSFPAMVLLFSVSRFFPLSMMVLVAVGWGFVVQNATTNTLIQAMVPDALRGRVMSVYTLIFGGFFPIGALMAGTVAQQFGTPMGGAFGAAIALAFGFFLLWRAPYLRRLP